MNYNKGIIARFTFRSAAYVIFMGKIAVVCVLERHDYGSFGRSAIAFDFSLVADFFPIDRLKEVQAPKSAAFAPF